MKIFATCVEYGSCEHIIGDMSMSVANNTSSKQDRVVHCINNQEDETAVAQREREMQNQK